MWQRLKEKVRFLFYVILTVSVIEKGMMKRHNSYRANIYLFKVNNRNTRKNCEICS